MLAVVAGGGAGLVMMHSPGRPEVMMERAEYDDVVNEVCGFLASRCREALQAGVAPDALVVDPGLGFGKKMDDNLKLVANFRRCWSGEAPVMLGPSRKRWLGEVCDIELPTERDAATAAAAAVAAFTGVEVLRTHDVKTSMQALKLGAALRGHTTG
jgi:dihydropteroate synthase